MLKEQLPFITQIGGTGFETVVNETWIIAGAGPDFHFL